MVLAGETLFVAGPPEVLDEPKALFRLGDREIQTALAAQAEALEGRRGAVLWAVSASDGRKLNERKLDAMPVWDGMAAAGGRLYLSCADGSLRCFSRE